MCIRDLTIKFANSSRCDCRGSSEYKPQYGLMTLASQCFTAVLLLIYGSLFLWCLLLSEYVLVCTALPVREFLASKQITVLEHPPYSPDLDPNDFFYVPEDKKKY
jgi:hypothetical protein